MNIKPEHIIRIENKISQLVDRYTLLKKEHDQLQNESNSKDAVIAALKERVSELELNLEKEKMNVKQLPEKGVAKPELEKKINDYIKEIDRCIAMLGEQD